MASFTVDCRAMLAALSAASAASTYRKLQPVLSTVFVSVDGDRVTFEGTNLEHSVRCSFQAWHCKPGQFVMPIDAITGIVKEFAPDDEVEIRGDEASVKVSMDGANFSVQTMDPNAFPSIDDIRPGAEDFFAEVDGDQLRKAFRLTMYAAAASDAKFHFDGVYLDGRNAAATNRSILAVSALEIPGIKPALVPIKSAKLVSDIAGDRIVIRSRGNNLSFSTECMEIMTRTVETRFPPYDDVMQGRKGLVISEFIDIEALASKLRQVRAVMLANDSEITDGSFTVNLEFKGDSIIVCAAERGLSTRGMASAQVLRDKDSNRNSMSVDLAGDLMLLIAKNWPKEQKMLKFDGYGPRDAILVSCPDCQVLVMPRCLEQRAKK